MSMSMTTLSPAPLHANSALPPTIAAPAATSNATTSLVDHSAWKPISFAASAMYGIISDEGVPG